MNATQRMKWYWSGSMIGILVILIGLLKLSGQPPITPVAPANDAHLPSFLIHQN
ncbi:MAG: hypothetical protein HC827_09025 [Cyanobacteria bacterium RM1_2_2]|nr:hypothetical protein [Cyanobacteria bacterium RM1_2_2]